MKLHHIGWAVRSIAASRPHFESELGLQFDGIESFPNLQVAFYDVGTCLVELLEATTVEETDVSTFIAAHGEGIHHLAYEVSDVSRALDEARAKGLRVLDTKPRPGARGTMIGFVDPRREDHVLVEYVELPGGPTSRP